MIQAYQLDQSLPLKTIKGVMVGIMEGVIERFMKGVMVGIIEGVMEVVMEGNMKEVIEGHMEEYYLCGASRSF